VGKLKLLLLLGLFFTISKSSAQIYDGHYLPFGLGYSHQTVKDNSFSPVSYSGHLGSISTGYYSQTKNWLSLLDISGFGAFLYPNVNRENNSNSAISISARLIYRMSYKVYEKRNWHFFAGLVNHNIWDYRDISSFSNNSFNFNGFFSAGINLSTQKNFELWNQNFGFQYTLAIPFVTYALRPGYIKPFLAEEIGSQDFYFWSDYFALDSKTELFWKINSNNLIRLTYQWEYSQLDELNKVQVAGHHLSLSTIFGF
tara:strand:+ start:1810 stop:2577 length:768 start_codon:yes stop_codon:yes gene_type:complete